MERNRRLCAQHQIGQLVHCILSVLILPAYCDILEQLIAAEGLGIAPACDLVQLE